MFGVTILGNNSALPAYDRHPTSQVVTIDDQLFLVKEGDIIVIRSTAAVGTSITLTATMTNYQPWQPAASAARGHRMRSVRDRALADHVYVDG